MQTQGIRGVWMPAALGLHAGVYAAHVSTSPLHCRHPSSAQWAANTRIRGSLARRSPSGVGCEAACLPACCCCHLPAAATCLLLLLLLLLLPRNQFS